MKNDSLEEKITRAESIAMANAKNLVNGHINQSLVKFLKSQSAVFLDFCCLFEPVIKKEINLVDSDFKEFMKMLIDARYAELENLIYFLNLIDHTLEIIKSRKHDFSN